ncbi:MAG: hypothetical protein LBR52_05095 [Prevotellaceae bacterium]|nr:hypothetical protein [Prevotellaceae bacterium]
MNKKTIVIFYYTQSGQALDIARNICIPLENGENEIIYKAIEPETPFPFPWTCRTFFEAFPESRLGIPTCKIKEMDLTDVAGADLVIISGQPWYLSPSLPLHAFFQDGKIKAYLKEKNIVNISGCRNMWVMTQRKIRKYIYEAGGNYVGHIVLQDWAPNLVSVLTIVRWLFNNQKAASRRLPAAGVSDEDIKAASRFGTILNETLANSEWSGLQEKLMQAHAVKYKPGVTFLEKTGHRMLGIWAKFIRKKGGYQDKRRELRIRLFCYYLFFVLYVASPVGIAVFYLTYPLRLTSIKKNRREMCYELNWNNNMKIQ